MVASVSSNRPDCLRQGEVLSDVREPELVFQPPDLNAPDGVRVDYNVHPLTIIMSTDCDLVRDYQARGRKEEADQEREARRLARQLNHIFCCPLFTEDEISLGQGVELGILKRIKEKRYERYLLTKVSDIIQLDPDLLSSELKELPDLYLDFTRTFALPTEFLYNEILRPKVLRKGVFPLPWRHEIVQRWAYYNGRVCVPDPQDDRIQQTVV